MSEHAVEAGPDPLGPAQHDEKVASRLSPRDGTPFGSVFNWVRNWYRELWKIPGKNGGKLDRLTISFILLQLFAGLPLLPYAVLHWHSENVFRFICFFAVALFASLLKVRLPGIEATMSANFLFILVGILDLTYAETLLMGCFGGLAQSFWQSKPRPRAIQILFNFANLSISITVAYLVFRSSFAYEHGLRWPFLLAAASTSYFIINTLSVSGIIAMTEGRNPISVWRECYLWSFPYYLLGALIAGGVSLINHAMGWQFAILVMPIVYWIYRSYRGYLDRLIQEKKHTEEIADLHLRTIEALSLAIEAKDHNTHDHLRRVQAYAMQLGHDLGLSDAELEALRAAALLHDIGKLAVPEQILAKPGRLTAEEFEKMKIHPTVGAEILDRVQFPYPVTPIVRSHHEKWNGKGYPEGLRGEAIPMGARILSVVDCFDALTSERPYRRAMSADDAMNYVVSEAGTSFDPRVVTAIEKRYRELEQVAGVPNNITDQPGIVAKVNRTIAPSTGFGDVPNAAEVRTTSFLASIVSARQEAQLLFELAQTLGNSLSLRETLSVVAIRLKEMIPYDLIVFYVCDQGKLIPRHVHGIDYELFRSLEIPVGQGIAGWVAHHEKPIINGDPAAESKYLDDPLRVSVLRSALAIPLRGHAGVAGVLALYRREHQAFKTDHLRMLLAGSSKLGLSMENALRFESAEDSASTDFLTGLPNARAICAHLEAELARCQRSGRSLAVLMCDLDGFKRVNDNFGHLVGNKLLQEISKSLRAMCRESDLVGRLGGDEFVLVLPEFGDVSAKEFQIRLESAVEEAGEAVCGKRVVSASVGTALYPQDGVTPEDLLSEADRAMYECKESHYKTKGQLLSV
jgi:diguanylate cyclase (GGDEF)-like protein/putative nucleotidyltransferase with HDIG domain